MASPSVSSPQSGGTPGRRVDTKHKTIRPIQLSNTLRAPRSSTGTTADAVLVPLTANLAFYTRPTTSRNVVDGRRLPPSVLPGTGIRFVHSVVEYCMHSVTCKTPLPQAHVNVSFRNGCAFVTLEASHTAAAYHATALARCPIVRSDRPRRSRDGA